MTQSAKVQRYSADFEELFKSMPLAKFGVIEPITILRQDPTVGVHSKIESGYIHGGRTVVHGIALDPLPIAAQ